MGSPKNFLNGAEWTGEHIVRASELWQTGLSAAKVGAILTKEFGIVRSRSSVLGALHRSRLERRGLAKSPTHPVSLHKRWNQTVAAIYRSQLPSPQRGSCVWPVGDPRKPGFRYCGHSLYPGRQDYCEHHCERAFKNWDEVKAGLG